MPGAKHPIEGHQTIGVIYLEILVMQVMGVGVAVECGAARLDLVEPDMAHHGPGAGDLQMIQHQQGMRRQHQMDQHIREIQQMFDRVHRQR